MDLVRSDMLVSQLLWLQLESASELNSTLTEKIKLKPFQFVHTPLPPPSMKDYISLSMNYLLIRKIFPQLIF